jgi:hypothetical protein
MALQRLYAKYLPEYIPTLLTELGSDCKIESIEKGPLLSFANSAAYVCYPFGIDAKPTLNSLHLPLATCFQVLFVW